MTGCSRCGQALAANSRFCAACGHAVAPSGQLSGAERLRWFVAGGVVVAAVGGLVLVLSGQARQVNAADGALAAAPFASGQEASAPDISGLSPRERFDRLFNRIMRAAESGDEATATRFAPMALSAFQMLDTVDADARYHAALIALHTGDVAGASAQADTILARDPGHLFGYIVRGTIARFEKDDKRLQQTYAEFLAHYDAEQARGRPEYLDHPKSLEDFRTAAKAGKPSKS